MNRSMCLYLCLSLMLVSNFAFADSAVTNAGVVVERYPLQIQKYQDLNFGTIAPSGSQSGTVVVSTAGVASATGGATLVNTSAVTSAAYQVYGVPNTAFSITLPADTQLSGPAGAVLVSEFVSSSGGTDVVGQQGVKGFTVGATLMVPTALLPGIYSGSFTVTVAYN